MKLWSWPMIQHETTRTSRFWTVIIPFKGTPATKSRLSMPQNDYPGIDEAARLQLARAFLQDTVNAALATDCVGHVIVVSGDPTLQLDLADTTVLPEPKPGLNVAIIAGLTYARANRAQTPLAILTGDLPSLEAHDLDEALQLAEQYPLSVVADQAGTGTTALLGLPGAALWPQFGAGSFHKHCRAGYHSLPIPLYSTLRQDVDTPENLHRAVERGVGAATLEAMQHLPTPEHNNAISLDG